MASLSLSPALSRRAALTGLGATSVGAMACQTMAPQSKASAPTSAFDEALAAAEQTPLPPPPNAAEFERRVQHAREQLRAQNAAALIVTPSTNLRYFTGVSWWLSERFFAWVLPVDDSPFVVVPAFELSRAEERFAATGVAVRTVCWREHEDPFALVAKTLGVENAGTANLGGGNVIVDPMAPLRFASGLRRTLGRDRTQVASNIIDALRAVKSDVEIACLRAANTITLRALRLTFAHLETGMTSTEVGQRVARAQQVLGGEDPWVLSLVGAAAAFPHGTKQAHVVKPGTGILVDTGISVHGYQSDLTRTVVFGTPDDAADAPRYARFIYAHHRVREAQTLALAAIAPGVAASHVDTVARKHLEAHGYGPGDKFFTHRLGHGIGLDGHEAPYLVGNNGAPLGVGNTASCEPGVYVPGEFGVRLEDIFVVTATGAKSLVPPQRGPFVDDV